jgi:hypothetical protein
MRTQRQHGVALVEFALIVPLILIIVLITADIGRALYQYNRVVKSVRNASRYLTTQAPDNADAATRARNLVVYGSTTGGSVPIDPGLTGDKVRIPETTCVGAAPNPVIRVVQITVTGYTFSPMIASFFGHDFGAISFSDISATMRHPL